MHYDDLRNCMVLDDGTKMSYKPLRYNRRTNVDGILKDCFTTDWTAPTTHTTPCWGSVDDIAALAEYTCLPELNDILVPLDGIDQSTERLTRPWREIAESARIGDIVRINQEMGYPPSRLSRLCRWLRRKFIEQRDKPCTKPFVKPGIAWS